jgi:hypothetical protein
MSLDNSGVNVTYFSSRTLVENVNLGGNDQERIPEKNQLFLRKENVSEIAECVLGCSGLESYETHSRKLKALF